MISFLNKVEICLLVSIICLSNYEYAFGQNSKWRIKNRLQASYEHDDNIRENPSDSLDRIQDSSLRFIFHSRASRSSPITQIKFSYQGGLQSYFQNSIENKLINEFESSAILRVQTFALGFRGNGRLKIYLNDALDYATGAAEAFVRLPMLLKFGHELAVQASGINYQNFSNFDYSQVELKWALSRKLASRLRGILEFSAKRVRYERMVIDFPSEDTIVFLDEKQKDNNYQLRLQLNYAKSFLLNLNYSFQHNTSNSISYEYYKHQITLILGLPLANGFWIRGYSAVQFKDYSEKSVPIFPTDVDTEREESNFFILDFSKDLNSSLSALVRFAYYNNESVIRSRFYRKSLLTLGFDLRF